MQISFTVSGMSSETVTEHPIPCSESPVCEGETATETKVLNPWPVKLRLPQINLRSESLARPGYTNRSTCSEPLAREGRGNNIPNPDSPALR